jgi:hypothetical protein
MIMNDLKHLVLYMFFKQREAKEQALKLEKEKLE